MRVELLAPHFIGGRLRRTKERLDVTEVTVLMLPLDAEAEAAVEAERLRVYARWAGPKWAPHLVDDPPRPFTFYNPPVPPIPDVGGPPGS